MVSFGGSSSRPRSKNLIRPEQIRSLKTLLPQLETAFQQTPGPEFFAGPSQTSLTSLDALEELALNFNQAGGIGEAGAQTRSTLSDIMDFAKQGPLLDEFFKASVSDPLLEIFTEDIQPAISRANLLSGFFGSQRLNQVSTANEQLVEEIARQRAALIPSFLDRALGAAQISTEGGSAVDATALAQIMQSGDFIQAIERARQAASLQERSNRVSQLLQAITGQTVGIGQNQQAANLSILGG